MRLELDAKRTLGTAVFAGALIFGGGAASAQEVDTYAETPPPEVLDEVETRQGEEPTTEDVLGDQVVASDTAARAQASGIAGLPVTGGDLLGLTALGAGAIALGGLALHQRRRYT